MLKLVVMKRAENAIYKVALYKARQYYPDTAEKFVNAIFNHCAALANENVKYAVCHNKVLAKHGFSCSTFRKKWVVVFKSTTTYPATPP